MERNHKRFMEMLEKKDYDIYSGDDELDEDIILDVLASLSEKDNKGY